MTKDTCEILILGAGLAGLSAAWHGGGRICEKSDICGGTCTSARIDGYTFDLGIHVLHTQDARVLKLLEQDLAVRLPQQRRSAWNYSCNTLTRYPFQANTFGLPIPVVKECLVSFIEARCAAKHNANQTFDNYEDWIIATFGAGTAKHFMIPYSKKFWTVPPAEMTTDWMDVRIPVPDLEEVVEGALTNQEKGFGPNAVFRYPANSGIAAIPDAFVNTGLDITVNKEAIKIDMSRKEVEFSDGTITKYNVLIATIPLPELVGIVDAPQQIRKAASKLRHNSVLCVNIGIDRPKVSNCHWIYYPEEKFCFFRISFLKNFGTSMAPDGKSSICAEVAYSSEQPIDKQSVAETVIKDLIAAKVLNNDDRIELIDLRDIRYAYVIYDHNRNQGLRIIRDFFGGNSIILAGRYSSWEYQWMDDAILDGKRASEEAFGLNDLPKALPKVTNETLNSG